MELLPLPRLTVPAFKAVSGEISTVFAAQTCNSRYSNSPSDSPASTSSDVSTWGNDLNRDFDVLSAVEQLLGCDIDPDEMHTAWNRLSEGGKRKTVRQLAEEIRHGQNSEPSHPTASTSVQNLTFQTDDDDDFGGGTCSECSYGSGCSPGKTGTPSWSVTDELDDDWQDSIGCSARSTPAVPMLKLNTMQKKMGGLPSASTWRRSGFGYTSRQCLEPSILRVLLPVFGQAHAPRASVAPAATAVHATDTQRASRITLDHLDQEQPAAAQATKAAAGTVPQLSCSKDARASDQELTTILTMAVAIATARVSSGGSGTDVQSVKDTCEGRKGSAAVSGKHSPAQPTPALAQPSRHGLRHPNRGSMLMRSIASHPLTEDWWVEYANESGSQQDGAVVLPETLWTVVDRLRSTANDDLTSRIHYEEQLANTAYSTVYTATFDYGFNSSLPVVVKKLDVASEGILANAFAEVVVLEHLAGWHGAVELLGYASKADQVALVLQQCDMDVRQWLDMQDHQGPKALVGKLRLFAEIAELLEGLHSRHVAHCDLKLDNLLVLGTSLVLSDFSEAVIFDSPAHAVLHESRGTEMYQCPEMLMGRPTNACAADCWALGCLLYELLTGKALFPGRSECLRPIMMQQSACTSRPVRWMSSSEDAVLRSAVGAGSALPDQGKGLADQVLQLLHSMVIDEHKRASVQAVVLRAKAVLRAAEHMQ